MSGNRKLAIWWAIGELVWLAVAAFNFWWHQAVLGVLVLLVGWIWGSVNIFARGFEDGVDASYEDVDDLLSRARILTHRLEGLVSKLTVDDEAPEPDVLAGADRACDTCGGRDFRVIGGRFVCTFCGSVLAVRKSEVDGNGEA